MEELNNYFQMSNVTAEELLNDILEHDNQENKIIVNDNIFTDTNINEWAKTKPATMGGVKIIEKIVKNPINDKKKLLKYLKLNNYYAICTGIVDNNYNVIGKLCVDNSFLTYHEILTVLQDIKFYLEH